MLLHMISEAIPEYLLLIAEHTRASRSVALGLGVRLIAVLLNRCLRGGTVACKVPSESEA